MKNINILRKIIMVFTLIFLIFVNYTVITGRRDLNISKNRKLLKDLDSLIKKELPVGSETEKESLKIENDSEYIYINLLELSNLINKNIKFVEENKFCIRGMVYNDRKLKIDNQFGLVRLMIWCCVADATPAGAVIQNNSKPEFKNKQWVKIYGKIELKKDKLKNCQWAIIPHKIFEINEPRNTYIFNAKEKEPFEY